MSLRGPVFWISNEYGSTYSCLTPLGAREGVKLILSPLIASEGRLVREQSRGWEDYSGDLARLEFSA